MWRFKKSAEPRDSARASDNDAPAWRRELMARCEQELRAMGQARLVDRVDHDPPGLLDVMFAYRLLLGRWPEYNNIADYQSRIGDLRLDEFVRSFLESSEFQARHDAASGIDLVVMRELTDMRLFFNLNDRQALRIATGHHEPEIQQVMRRLMAPGVNAIDAGAHIGLYTMLMARGGGQVWSFEPMPGTFDLLKRNVGENGFESTVHLTRAACHQHPGAAKLYLPEAADLGPAYIRPADQADQFPGSVMEVPMVRIDDIVPEDVRIGLAKLDIEGNEPFALRGMERILRQDRPILFTEFLPHAMGVNPNEHLAWLRRQGYEVFDVVEFSREHRRAYAYREGEPPANLVCLPQ